MSKDFPFILAIIGGIVIVVVSIIINAESRPAPEVDTITCKQCGHIMKVE